MALVVLRDKKGNYLGSKAEDGTVYSEYTITSASQSDEWMELSEFLNDNPWYRLTIFESEIEAQKYIDQYKENFEIIKLFELGDIYAKSIRNDRATGILPRPIRNTEDS